MEASLTSAWETVESQSGNFRSVYIVAANRVCFIQWHEARYDVWWPKQIY